MSKAALLLSEVGLACSPRGGAREEENKMWSMPQAFLVSEEMQAELFHSPEKNTAARPL